MFFGIIIKMYNEQGNKHNCPHLHAEYQDEEIVIDFDGNILEGDFPKSKLKLLLAWTEIHKEELHANWKLLSSGEGYFKIDPLK